MSLIDKFWKITDCWPGERSLHAQGTASVISIMYTRLWEDGECSKLYIIDEQISKQKVPTYAAVTKIGQTKNLTTREIGRKIPIGTEQTIFKNLRTRKY